jgi:adenine-specific DNA methylase
VGSFEELRRVDNAALLRCDTAEDLAFVPDKSVDAVITDPPYFDNIQYSELADFFYVWLRLGLKELYPWFDPGLSSRPNEIVQNEKMGKTVEFFSEGLTRAFAECHRVLKDEGLLVFTFHHNKLWAWESIAKALLDSGFYISATPVVRSEGKSGFHSSKGNIRYDSVLVCRKGPGPSLNLSWSSLRKLILKEAVVWTRRTVRSGMLITQVDVLTIIMGKTVEYCTKAFPNMKHYKQPITLAEALNEMKDFASHVAESSRPTEPPLAKSYSKKAEQLTLLLTESKERYEARRRAEIC